MACHKAIYLNPISNDFNQFPRQRSCVDTSAKIPLVSLLNNHQHFNELGGIERVRLLNQFLLMYEALGRRRRFTFFPSRVILWSSSP
ncbi:UNVERIFIED_CONTAM: hypothetical protein GTU68_057803 [Idotea baltica]|nr:hypothetical protein [Idotea baltica]